MSRNSKLISNNLREEIAKELGLYYRKVGYFTLKMYGFCRLFLFYCRG